MLILRQFFKKGDATDKTNYRRISTLSNFSKVFEKMIYAQISSFMEPKLSKYLAGFRAKHNTQHALPKMIEIWRAMLSKGSKVGVNIMDLSKAFKTLNHNLLLCKLKAYSFNKNALTFIQSYFTNRQQKWEISLANGKGSQQVYPKVPFLVLYFSTFSSTTSFFLLKLLHHATMQMTILFR